MPQIVGPIAESRALPSTGLPESLGRSLPHLEGQPMTRFFCRWAVSVARNRVLAIEGIHHALSDRPMVVVANHSQRAEAVLLPGLLLAYRDGRRVHFMADWPMMLVPGVGMVYRCGEVIPVFAKSARPAFLNVFKPLFQQPGTAWQRAGELLKQGKSVGVFLEGTMNRRPDRLLRGRVAAARLAIEHGVDVLPIGIRFSTVKDRPISDRDPFSVHVGAPVSPPVDDGERQTVQHFHARVMERVSSLCGKSWHPDNPKRRSRS